MGYFPGPQMRYPARSSNIDTKDKLTIIVATLALLVSVGALLTSVNSCRQSATSNEIAASAYGVAQRQESIASSQADLARREAEGGYTVAFTVWLERGGSGTVSEEVSWSEEEDFTISKSELFANTTWLSIDITNTGNRPVIVHDIGLVTNREGGKGAWARTHGYQKPDYCGQDAGGDIRCYQFPLTVAVGGWFILKWPVWLDADYLLEQKAVNPIVVGINTHNRQDVFETNLAVR
ncbi:hypothetical protein [Nocardia sp. NPDC057440]|uniref:hypothetical protein n=1 Tax=Nocardia sp. NPDC057440 TaxID=3346134 RepID=UPI00366D13BE